DWARRRDARDDQRLAEAQGLRVEAARDLSADERARIRALYGDLYRGKYSRTNPDYSAALLGAAVESGVLKLRLIRNDDGVIEGFVGEHVYQGALVNPLLGYDRALPQARGLYRIAMAASIERAITEGLTVNWSAGAGGFKRNRGARPALEFCVVFDDHLPAWRRMTYRALAAALNALAPMLERIALK
nr:GNAT family N-acetyltransferase [Terricaulis sp.]